MQPTKQLSDVDRSRALEDKVNKAVDAMVKNIRQSKRIVTMRRYAKEIIIADRKEDEEDEEDEEDDLAS